MSNLGLDTTFFKDLDTRFFWILTSYFSGDYGSSLQLGCEAQEGPESRGCELKIFSESEFEWFLPIYYTIISWSDLKCQWHRQSLISSDKHMSLSFPKVDVLTAGRVWFDWSRPVLQIFSDHSSFCLSELRGDNIHWCKLTQNAFLNYHPNTSITIDDDTNQYFWSSSVHDHHNVGPSTNLQCALLGGIIIITLAN